MIKKGKGLAAPRLDDTRPTKAAPPPSGRRAIPKTDVEPSRGGPKKTEKNQSRKARTGRAKTPFKPDAVRRPRSASGVVPVEGQIARSSRDKSATHREQYIRLRIRVHNDRLSVVDSHL